MSGSLTLNRCIVTGNSAANGGAFNNAALTGGPGGLLTINESVVTNNTSTSTGGALQNFSTSTARIANSEFSGNTAGGNGGAIGANGMLHITNSTISNNIVNGAGDDGGGVQYNGTTGITITNTTIANNSALGDGGGLFRTGTTSPVNIRNNIIALNTNSSGVTPDIGGTYTSQGNNLIGNVGTAVFPAGPGDQIGTAGMPIDPQLAALANNGGFSQTRALLAGSTAIDAGNNALALDLDGLPLVFDQRGTGFPRISNTTVDIGAFEVQAGGATPTPTPTPAVTPTPTPATTPTPTPGVTPTPTPRRRRRRVPARAARRGPATATCTPLTTIRPAALFMASRSTNRRVPSRLLAGFPVAAQNGGINSIVSERMTVDQANGRLYVINDSSDTVSAYAINPTTGVLTAMPFSPISLGTGGWNTIAVHPSGSPLVIGGNTTNGPVHSFAITSTTATAAAGSPYPMGAAVAGFSGRFSKDGNFYYVGGNSGANIGGFSVDSGTGVLTTTAGSPFPTVAATLAYATDGAGRLFGVDTANAIRVFTSSAGALSPVAGNPFTSGLTQRRMGIIHPSENFYMVAGNSGNNVGVFQIAGSGAATTVAPVAGSPFATGATTANGLVTNAAGTFLFVNNRISRSITAFSVNIGSGVLTNLGSQPSNTLGSIGAINGIGYFTAAGRRLS